MLKIVKKKLIDNSKNSENYLVGHIDPFPGDFLARPAHSQHPRHPLEKNRSHLKKQSLMIKMVKRGRRLMTIFNI